MKGSETVKRFPAVFDTDADTVRVVVAFKPEKIIKTFKAVKGGKPCVHMARESVMLHYKGFNPQIHSVTVSARTSE